MATLVQLLKILKPKGRPPSDEWNAYDKLKAFLVNFPNYDDEKPGCTCVYTGVGDDPGDFNCPVHGPYGSKNR